VIAVAAVIAVATAAGIGIERRLGERAEELSRRILTWMLWVPLPIVGFFGIAALELSAEVGAGIAFAYAGQACALAAAWVVGRRVLGLGRPALGALLVVAAFGNTGYLGLPVTAAAFGFDELPNALAFDVVVTGIGIVTVGFSIGAAFGTRGQGLRERIGAFLARNPLLWASLAGLVAPDALAPDVLVDASQLLAVAILVPGFFAVGVTLAAEAEEGVLRFPPPLTAPVAWAVALKLTVPPAVVLAGSRLVIDVPGSYVVQAAMASALATILIANEYGLDRGLTAAAIAWSTAIVIVVALLAAPGLG
jgi:malate permease and related proteins